MNTRRSEPAFRFDMAEEDRSARWSALWSGHIDEAGIAAFCAAIDKAVGARVWFDLLLDVRGVSGHDAEAHIAARRWSVGPVAQRVRAVALVLDSAMMIALSPAASLCPPGRVEVFGTMRAAAAWLDGSPLPGSGEFARVDLSLRVVRRALGEE